MTASDDTSRTTTTQGSTAADDAPRDTRRASLLQAERHSTDALSLIFGLLFLTIAALGLAGELRPIVIEGDWIGPVVLIGIGIALIASIRRDR
ncbi:MAG: hypothetical protein R3343_02535 [Nitriliruptorales bacterium]|nr:hypothetical protein [Nitriliruptorales bacterium]